MQRSGRGAILLNRNIWLIYIAYIAILWNLWFFSFWSVQIVKESAQSSLLVAALTAAFNAGAGILGFPAGGWLADWAVRTGRSRKTLALVCTAVYSVLVLIFGWSIQGGGKPSLALLGLLLFTSGLFFNALQPIVQGMTGDMVPANERGSAFGMLNLISEIGAVASPVVSGILHDATGSWAPGVYVAAGIMIISFFLYLMVRERRPTSTPRRPHAPPEENRHVTPPHAAFRHFPVNAWYAAAWDHEVGRNLLAKTIAGRPIVFYRTTEGRPVALADACWHRLAPLSMGKLRGADEIQCGYHGICYDADGRATFMPAQETINPSATVHSYPVVERHRYVWVWPGDPALADPDLVPDLTGTTTPSGPVTARRSTSTAATSSSSTT